MYKHTMPEEKKRQNVALIESNEVIICRKTTRCISLYDLSKPFFVTYGTMESNMSCSVCNTDTSFETRETMDGDIVC
jgi:hypothetical protein